MKQNEKDLKNLLLKDLCSRLPYGVKVQTTYINPQTKERKDIGTDVLSTVEISMLIDGYEEHKPYLFPLSSMTDKQKEEYEDALVYHDYINGGWTITKTFNDEYVVPYWFVDFCNKHHLDYRGLIPMGLAIDATGLDIY